MTKLACNTQPTVIADPLLVPLLIKLIKRIIYTMPNGVSTKCYIMIKKDLCYFIEKNHFMNYAYIIRKIQIYET